VATLRLQASDGKTLLIAGTNYHDKTSYHDGWWYCSVFLEAKNETIKLGEGDFEQIRSQLLSSLHPPYETKKGVFCGKEVDFFWVFNLMGPHAAIYGVPFKENMNESDSYEIRGVDLYWQKVDIEKHLIMKLNEEDVQSWLKILKNTEQLPEEEDA